MAARDPTIVITLIIDHEQLVICAEEMYRALRLDSCWCHEVVKVVNARNQRIQVKCSRCQVIQKYEALMGASIVLGDPQTPQEAAPG